MNLEQIRREYIRERLDESSVAADPVVQFGAWYAEAERAGVLDPNAMTLATATADGRPSARIVLLRSFGADGFVFYTDYRSRKSTELTANPIAELLFYWGELERQVRVIGPVSRVSREMSEAYFRTRPVGSQLGAWASHQSTVLPGGRPELEQRLHQVAARFAEQPVPLPPHWGGWRLAPEEYEYWQGRESRLHDRIRYRRTPAGGWTVDRLSP